MSTHPLDEFTPIPRDRYGRPMVVPPEGGKPAPYTRISTLCKTLDDQTGLMRWKQRQTIAGLAVRDDLMTLAKSAGGDTRTLNDIAEQAMDAAGSSAAANRGTALHSFCEAIDAGRDVNVPDMYAADLDAYRAATAVLDVVMAERFVVVDHLRAAGSFDRLVRLPNGTLVIADIKTGKDAAKYAVATAAQVALYAHGQLYDPATGLRTPLPDGVNPAVGLLIHLPAGAGVCHIHRLDLTFGWNFAEVAVEVREWRKRKPATHAWSAP